METKFKLGDEVIVDFMGKVTEIYLIGDKVFYAIQGNEAMARRVEENQMTLLPEPKDFSTEKA